MTMLVCSSCDAAVSADAGCCPHCGPDGPPLLLRDEPAGWAHTGDPAMAERLGRALGPDYDVRRFLGRGGFAEVYEVQDRDLQRRLAVKVLRPDMVWSGGVLARFKQEARAIARLNHPNTVPIHFVGEGEGLVFYAMPFIEGQSLGDLLRVEGALDAERTIAIAVPILEALDYAHRQGLVHRDIKPDNILVESGTGRALLVDFGIAKSVDGGNIHDTQSGFVVGTPHYMAPEQALGHPNVDARADLYAMGAVLFQMLTGGPPFEGATSQEIVSRHLTEPVPPPVARNVRIPPWLSDVIVRCMAKRPAERYQSAAEVLTALRQSPEPAQRDAITASRVAAALGRDAPTIEMDPADAPAAPKPRARPWGWAAAIAATGLLIAGGAWVTREPATLVMLNRLVEPVLVTVAGVDRLVPPGDSLRMPLRRGAALDAAWHVVRPRSGAGAELGLMLRGTIRDDDPHGEIRRSVDLWTLGRSYVAPVVINETGGPLRVTIRDERGAGLDCDCTVAAGATMALGYHDPARIASIEFTDLGGRSARVSPLASRADRTSGAADIRLAAVDFATDPVMALRRRRVLPLIELPAPRAEPIADSLLLLAADSGRAAARPAAAVPARTAPSPVRSDPLRGTVTNH